MNDGINNTKDDRNSLDVTLKSVDFIRDRSLLVGWLNSEAVSKWWGNPTSRVRQIEKTPSKMHALICFSGSPVGYICWQKVIREELDSVKLYDVPDNLIDFDIFIGDPNYRGTGIGPQAIKLLLTQLGKDSETLLVGLATSINNQSAIFAFEKTGFCKKYQFDSVSFGKCWFMTYEITQDKASQ